MDPGCIVIQHDALLKPKVSWASVSPMKATLSHLCTDDLVEIWILGNCD